MKSVGLLILTVGAMVISGCRREDIREFTIDIPGLSETNKAQVIDAFVIRRPGQPEHLYDGIRPETFKFDFEKKTLTMRYDSMKIARTNIRMLIRDKGLEVTFPTNATGVAGYIDNKTK